MEKQNHQPEKANEAHKQRPPLALKWKLAYVGIGALFVAGLVLVARQTILLPNLSSRPPTPPVISKTPAETPAFTPSLPDSSAQPSATPTPAQRDIEVPSVIYFTEQKQECPIIPVGIGEGNSMGSPESASEAGWFYYSASPGDPGNAVLNGHQAFGGKKGVFSVLKKMKPGEQVIIEFKSGLLRFFEVERIESYLKEDVPVEYVSTGSNTETQLTLITCLGDYGLDGLSLSRVVVVCKENLDLRHPDDAFVDTREVSPNP